MAAGFFCFDLAACFFCSDLAAGFFCSDLATGFSCFDLTADFFYAFLIVFPAFLGSLLDAATLAALVRFFFFSLAEATLVALTGFFFSLAEATFFYTFLTIILLKII